SLGAPPELRLALTLDELREAQAATLEVYVDPTLVSYAVTLCEATRAPEAFGAPQLAGRIAFGASPRGSISLIHAARALALLRGRTYVVPADLDELLHDALRHRLVLTYRALAEDTTPDAVLDAAI